MCGLDSYGGFGSCDCDWGAAASITGNVGFEDLAQTFSGYLCNWCDCAYGTAQRINQTLNMGLKNCEKDAQISEVIFVHSCFYLF